MNKIKNMWFSISSILCLIIMILIFIIIGYSNSSTKIYKFSGSGEYISFKNGLAVFSSNVNIIKLNDYNGENYNNLIKNINLSLYINNNLTYKYEKNSEEGFYLKDILKDLSINLELNDLIKNKNNIFEKDSYIELKFKTIDNKNLKEKIMFDIFKY